ncbi:MAG TPA: type II toxin-antitoxin system VapC family toxin [Verrucomicrobiota bacterium]|nr:type II toxin-antitoxin system VapC family toxin [Verrucomicrobiota bacterium]HNU51017.1 type II toxin-antitoxin system VapC family toxin [Verrucomicrobiota bacterium]
MIYIDTSCLLKLFRPEPLSAAVRSAVAAESTVVVSALAELEAQIQLRAAWKAGDFTRPQWRRLEVLLARLRHQVPFEFRPLGRGLFDTAFRQHRQAGNLHCRTLDRLHLAAMEELDVDRLMTHDRQQASAATAIGFLVVQPGQTPAS